MGSNYKSFRIFHQEEQAQETLSILEEANIDCALKVTPPGFNAIFATTSNYEAELFVNSDEFQNAKVVLVASAGNEADAIDQSHYLYDFTDVELYEVFFHKGEWNELDVEIAERILSERGVTNFDLLKEELFLQNPKKYQTPQKSKVAWIITGYFFAIFLTLIGICIGIYISTKKHKLPDGSVVHRFSRPDQIQGQVIALIGLVVFLSNIYFKALGFWDYL